MELKQIPLGPIGTNCYIVYDSGEGIIIDPGAEGEVVEAFLTREAIKPIAILLTHAHFDHIGAVDQLRKSYDIPLYIHEDEKTWLSNPNLNGSARLIGAPIQISTADHFLKQGPMQLGAFEFEVIRTPGHSPGSVSFYFAEDQAIISGDVLFYRGIGRTDLVGGDYQQLEVTIRQKLYVLPEEVIVYSGHGNSTTIGEEKRNNPFITI